MKRTFISFIGAVCLMLSSIANAQTLLGSTNTGDLLEIDLSAGTVQLIGSVTGSPGWADLALDPAGNLFAVSRRKSEPVTFCFGIFSDGECAHLYRLNPSTGAIIQHIGDLKAAFVSDIEFAADGTLYASRYVDERRSEDAGLVTIDPATAVITPAPNIRFGPGSTGLTRGLSNGGLSLHPVTGDLWAVEIRSLDGTIFRVDPLTGLAIDPVVPLGLNGSPTGFPFDGLEILPDGTFIATRGGGGGGMLSPGELYEINPVADPTTGRAEVTLISLTFDPAITGHVNGLTASTEPMTVVALKVIVAEVLVLNLQEGISNSLDAKISAALVVLDDMNLGDNDIAAVNSLEAFINAVMAQSGTKISETDADALISAAQEIINLLRAVND